MPIVNINNISENTPSSPSVVKPIIGLAPEDYISSENQCIFCKDKSSYLSQIGYPNLDTMRLLDSGYSVMVAPSKLADYNRPSVRINKDGFYCHPDINLDGVMEENDSKQLEDLDNLLSTDYTYAVEFPYLNITEPGFIILTNGYYWLLAGFTDTGELRDVINPLPPHISKTRVFPLGDYTDENNPNREKLRSYLINAGGFIAQDFPSCFILMRSEKFSSTSESSFLGFKLKASLDGNSSVLNKWMKPSIDFFCKNDRYLQDLSVNIVQFSPNKWIINVLSNGVKVEQHFIDNTSYSIEEFNTKSEILDLTVYSYDFPTGLFHIRRDYLGKIEENKELKTSQFYITPIPSIILADNMEIDMTGIYSFIRRKEWRDYIVAFSGVNTLKDGSTIPSDIYYCTKLLTGNLFGKIDEITHIDGVIDNTNHIDNLEYEYGISSFMEIYQNEERSILFSLFCKFVDTLIINNFNHRINVSDDEFNRIMDYIKSYKMIKDISVINIQKETDRIIYTLSIILDCYTGDREYNSTISIDYTNGGNE